MGINIYHITEFFASVFRKIIILFGIVNRYAISENVQIDTKMVRSDDYDWTKLGGLGKIPFCNY